MVHPSGRALAGPNEKGRPGLRVPRIDCRHGDGLAPGSAAIAPTTSRRVGSVYMFMVSPRGARRVGQCRVRGPVGRVVAQTCAPSVCLVPCLPNGMGEVRPLLATVERA